MKPHCLGLCWSVFLISLGNGPFLACSGVGNDLHIPGGSGGPSWHTLATFSLGFLKEGGPVTGFWQVFVPIRAIQQWNRQPI